MFVPRSSLNAFVDLVPNEFEARAPDPVFGLLIARLAQAPLS